MRNGQHGSVLRQIHVLYGRGTFAGLSDGELLDRFDSRDGEAAELAFATLVERHGAMVLNVCRRVLHDAHDAHDAFQATFLVLARKGRGIRDRESVGNWLYGVASRVATNARDAATRRRFHEVRFARWRGNLELIEDPDRDDERDLLHEEIGRLPERYRVPIMLCHLQGLTHEEAALRLGRPVGTVRSRLARGRERLRVALLRRGLAPSGGALSAALADQASAMVPRVLADSTVKSALSFVTGRAATAGVVSATVAALTEGMLRSMFMTKLKLGAAILTAVATATATGALAYQDSPKPASTPAPERPLESRILAGGKGEGRSAAVGQYLEKTKAEVDLAVTDLRAEVADLRARLEQAASNLRRMEALQAALKDEGAPSAFADFLKSNTPRAADRRYQPAQGTPIVADPLAPISSQPPSVIPSYTPSGIPAQSPNLPVNRDGPRAQAQPPRPEASPNPLNVPPQPPTNPDQRRRQLAEEIDRLIQERDRLGGELPSRKPHAGPPF
jgi:RNA polymerase sigma factor (sigma-70 family)